MKGCAFAGSCLKCCNKSAPPINIKTQYSYDRAGRRTRMESGNRDVRYRYGKNGELLQVTDNLQRLEVRYAYGLLGRETQRIYGNGVRQETLFIGKDVI